MSWLSAIKIATTEILNTTRAPRHEVPRILPKPLRPKVTPKTVDWNSLITLDFETYFDDQYSLRKISTSEYVRDERFKAQVVGVKIGKRKTFDVPHEEIEQFFGTIDWDNTDILCHNTAFDAFILSQQFDIHPRYIYDTLSMARALHGNDIGASLDEVAKFYHVGAKTTGVLEQTKGVRDWDDELYAAAADYCCQDVELCHYIFEQMLPKMPAMEMDLIDYTIRMFTEPVLRVDIPRVQKELQRELDEREAMIDRVYSIGLNVQELGLTKKILAGDPDQLKRAAVKKALGSNEQLVTLFERAGIDRADLPMKASPSWIKANALLPLSQRQPISTAPYVYAFSKDEPDFVNLYEQIELFSDDLDLNAKGSAFRLAIRQAMIRTLVEARLMIKSTTNITRAERFLEAGKEGYALPAGYSYFRAHTGRWGGNNKMNMQNLKRGGELRLSILAPEGYVLCVVDSGQIEARVNGWLWGQADLLAAFKSADLWDKSWGTARGSERDAYCLFADTIYRREITTEDKTERFVGKVCVLGLGFQMGATKLQITLAKGALGGPPVEMTLGQCRDIVNTYRNRNDAIVRGWEICNRIIEDMASGTSGAFGPLSWEKGRIWLPNGLSLQYPELKKTQGAQGFDWSYRAGRFRSKIYGGLLCENIVQALARNVIAEQLCDIATKQRVVMITHDEIVTCVKKENAEKAFKLMETAMRTPPSWCQTIPLNCEGGWAENYSK